MFAALDSKFSELRVGHRGPLRLAVTVFIVARLPAATLPQKEAGFADESIATSAAEHPRG